MIKNTNIKSKIKKDGHYDEPYIIHHSINGEYDYPETFADEESYRRRTASYGNAREVRRIVNEYGGEEVWYETTTKSAKKGKTVKSKTIRKDEGISYEEIISHWTSGFPELRLAEKNLAIECDKEWSIPVIYASGDSVSIENSRANIKNATLISFADIRYDTSDGKRYHCTFRVGVSIWAGGDIADEIPSQYGRSIQSIPHNVDDSWIIAYEKEADIWSMDDLKRLTDEMFPIGRQYIDVCRSIYTMANRSKDDYLSGEWSEYAASTKKSLKSFTGMVDTMRNTRRFKL